MDAIRSAAADLQSVTRQLAGADVAELTDGELTEHIAELHRAENQLRAAQVQAAGQLEGRPVVAEEGFKGAAGYLAHHHRLRYRQFARTVSLAKKRWVAPETAKPPRNAPSKNAALTARRSVTGSTPTPSPTPSPEPPSKKPSTASQHDRRLLATLSCRS